MTPRKLAAIKLGGRISAGAAQPRGVRLASLQAEALGNHIDHLVDMLTKLAFADASTPFA